MIIHVEIFLRDMPGSVGAEESDHEHEGFGVLFLESLDGPVGGHAIAHFTLFAGVGSPVGESLVAVKVGFDLLSVLVPVVIPLSASAGEVEIFFWEMFVENLSDGHRFVSMFFEVAVEELGAHGFDFFFDELVFCLKFLGLELMKIEPAHDAGTRWSADRVLAVGSREPGAFCRQAIHVWRDHLGMTPIACPIVEVINGDKEDIGFVRQAGGRQQKSLKKQSRHSLHE